MTVPNIGKLSLAKKTPLRRAREEPLLYLSNKLKRSLRSLMRHLLPPQSKTATTTSLYLPMVPNLRLLRLRLNRASNLLLYHKVIWQDKKWLCNLYLKNLLPLSLWKIKPKDLQKIKLQSKSLQESKNFQKILKMRLLLLPRAILMRIHLPDSPQYLSYLILALCVKALRRMPKS